MALGFIVHITWREGWIYFKALKFVRSTVQYLIQLVIMTKKKNCTVVSHDLTTEFEDLDKVCVQVVNHVHIVSWIYPQLGTRHGHLIV